MEKKVLKKIKKGDTKAFRSLYDHYIDHALVVAYGILKDKTDVNDAVQEAFIRVFRNIHSYDESKSFKAWLSRIVMNECYRLIEKRKNVVSIESIADSRSVTEEDGEDEDLTRAIEQLDEIYRLPIVLKYVEEYSLREIAELLEIPENTVKTRLFNGKKKLKEHLEKVYAEEELT